MRIFFDTEFLEDGKTIDLISIGMVREDGAEYYAVNDEFHLNRLYNDDWMSSNVLPHLPVIVTNGLSGKPIRTDKYINDAWRLRSEIRDDILAFVGEKPEWWAYFADYDWVVLCQLFGRMIDLPKGWPMYCRDLKQEMDGWCYRADKQTDGEHNALADARWVRDSYNELVLDGWSFN